MTYLRWINDSDGDGIPDDVMTRIIPEPPQGAADRDFWPAMLDLAAQIGLHTAALPFPLFILDNVGNLQSATLASAAQVRDLCPQTVSQIRNSDQQPGTVSACLTKLFTIDGMLADHDGDLVPDATHVTFELPDNLPLALGAALANLAARTGLESGGISLPLTDNGGVAFRIEPGSEQATLTASADGWLAAGIPGDLATLINRVAEQWPHINAPETGGVGYSLDWLRRALAGDGPEHRNSSEPAWELQWSERWEVDRLWQAFLDLLPKLDSIAPLTLTIMASEPLAIQRSLVRRVEQELQARGFTSATVKSFCTFKSGLSWLREEIIPHLREQAVSRVHIVCRACDIDEASLDRPTRWLQELFPGDEILARDLHIPLDAIAIELADDQDPTFRAEAFDDAGDLIGSWTFSPLSRTLPFVQAIPESGTVRVTTSGIIAEQGDVRTETPVESDLETFWSFWQGEVIPRLLKQIDARGGARRDLQPFFDRLEAEVWISEPNSRLGIREESDSAAEALHEDIYFNTLDAIEMYGERQTGDSTSAPGAVIPIVRVTSGGTPHARVRLLHPPERPSLPYVDLTVRSLRLRDGELILDILIEDPSPETLARLIEIAGLLNPDGPSIAARVSCGESAVELRLPLQTLIAADSKPATPPPMDQNIHGHAVIDQLSSLAVFPGVTAWIEDYSYEGRPIPAIAIHPATPGRLRSTVKLAAVKPTCLIVARHHANEISSTNAALQLVWLTQTDPEWQALARRVNLVVIPYENPDGAALHARLASDPAARNWKHHPARYNALGTEFSQAFFDRNTRFGESRVRPALWQRFLPDAVVDNHGVPSHEWVQPFAGFGSPPRFRVSYWIPQALLYGIIGYVDSDDFPEHAEMAVALRHAVSDAVRQTDIGRLNAEIGRSYRTWGQERDPERFPGEFHSGMLWHMAGAPPNPEGRGFAFRYPATTVLNWVTEVNDETAEGAHLERTARAHLIANHAMIQLLGLSAEVPSRAGLDAHGHVRWIRHRPLMVQDR